MERQEFLKTLGISFAAVCAGSCLSACGKDDSATPTPPPPAGSFVTADLSDISAIGGKKIVSGIAFFRIGTGNTASDFLAIQPNCTHQNGELNWSQNSSLIQCNLHQAQFDTKGITVRQPQNSSGLAANLKVYDIIVSNSIVTAKLV